MVWKSDSTGVKGLTKVPWSGCFLVKPILPDCLSPSLPSALPTHLCACLTTNQHSLTDGDVDTNPSTAQKDALSCSGCPGSRPRTAGNPFQRGCPDFEPRSPGSSQWESWETWESLAGEFFLGSNLLSPCLAVKELFFHNKVGREKGHGRFS